MLVTVIRLLARSIANSINVKVVKYEIPNLSTCCATVSLQVLCQCFAFFTMSDQPTTNEQIHLLWVEENCCERSRKGLLWATNFGYVAYFPSNLLHNKLLMLHGKLRFLVSHISPPLAQQETKTSSCLGLIVNISNNKPTSYPKGHSHRSAKERP